MISSAEVDPELIHMVARAVFDDLEAFRAIRPAWGGLTPEGMISEGLSAPLHEGALRYYRETGLLPEAETTPEQAAPEPETDVEGTDAESQQPEAGEGTD